MKQTLVASVIALGIALGVVLARATDKPALLDQQGYMVWGAGCISSVDKTLQAKAVAPLDKNGDPDRKHGWITGLVANLRPNCGHIEIHPHDWDGK